MLVQTPFHHVTRDIIAAAIEVHRVLGPGLLESAYTTCLQRELAARKLSFATEYPIPLVYKGVPLDCQYRLDLLVEDAVVVEVKAIDSLLPVHQAQVLTYLKLANLPVGLLVNFHVDRLVNGVKRIINPRWKASEALPSVHQSRSAEGTEGTKGTVSQEERRNEGERS